MIFAGLDLSLTATGLSVIRDDSEPSVCEIKSKAEANWREFPDRVDQIMSKVREEIFWRAATNEPVFVVIEAPAYGAKGDARDRLMGAWWIAVRSLADVTLYKATPQQVKKFATGAGNADKDRVLASVVRRYPEVNVMTNNEADALTLAHIAAEAAGRTVLGYKLNDAQMKIVRDVRNGKVLK